MKNIVQRNDKQQPHQRIKTHYIPHQRQEARAEIWLDLPEPVLRALHAFRRRHCAKADLAYSAMCVLLLALMRPTEISALCGQIVHYAKAEDINTPEGQQLLMLDAIAAQPQHKRVRLEI